MAQSIAERQTAYLKGRLINDNVRAILSTINVTNAENVAGGLIVALDAKKAFDSVSHSYIRDILRNFGCGAFVRIFNILYKDLQTDILINGSICKGYQILRGVKQGDALSCIIFIMCMEPLLRNIEANIEIRPIRSNTLEAELPKVYAYADDVNGTIADSPGSIRCLFKEYERLSRKSGLELNADKTEVMRLGNNPPPRSYRVEYLGRQFDVDSCDQLKINGISFQRNHDRILDVNVAAVCEKINKNMTKWSRRGLSTLGKILIAKTFGISQIIYLLQSMVLKNAHVKVLNAFLYKFIWNRRYGAAKAPERIKRLITNTPVKLGGLGMLDIETLDASLKLKALGRLLETKHPFLLLIKNKLDLVDFFNPKCRTTVDSVTNVAISKLKEHRSELWNNGEVGTNRFFLALVKECRLTKLVSSAGLNSIAFFQLHRNGRRVVGDLSARELESISRFIDRGKFNVVKKARTIPNQQQPNNPIESIFVKGIF